MREDSTNRVWQAIDDDRRQERMLKRISFIAWSATFTMALVYAVLGAISTVEMVRAAMSGAVPWFTAFGSAVPLIVVLGLLSVLIAVLATIGVFARNRQATLHEIQLRLAALEESLPRNHRQ